MTIGYVVQHVPKYNVASALDHVDEVKALLSADDEAQLLNIPNIVFKLNRDLARFTRDDYLVLMGNPVSIGIACAIVSELTGGIFKVLKWDNQTRCYYPLDINISQKVQQ